MRKVINKILNVKSLVIVAFLITITFLSQLTIFSLDVVFSGTKFQEYSFYLLLIESILILIPILCIDFNVKKSKNNEFNKDKDKELDNGFVSFLLLLYIIAIFNTLFAITYFTYNSMALSIFYMCIISSFIIVCVALDSRKGK